MKPQAGLLGRLLHVEKLHKVMKGDTSTHSAKGWVYHFIVSPEAAGPGALKETTQNNVFYFICTSPVIASKPDTVVEIHHHQVGPAEEAVQHIAGGVRRDTTAGIKVLQV